MGEPQKPRLTLNQKIVVWARGRLGKKVGRGLCWDLGELALSHNGAQTSNDLGPVGDDTDYIWGEPISVKDVKPGDLLQFRDHVVTTITETKYTFHDKSKQLKTVKTTANRGHHTVIVRGMLDANGAVKILEQHVKPKGDIVQKMHVNTRDVPAIVTKSLESRMNPTTKKIEAVEVTKTVKIIVKGTIWAYRPKPK